MIPRRGVQVGGVWRGVRIRGTGGALGLAPAEGDLRVRNFGPAALGPVAGLFQARFVLGQLGAETGHVLLGSAFPPKEKTFAVGAEPQQRFDPLVGRLPRHAQSPSGLIGSSGSPDRSDVARSAHKDTPATDRGSDRS